MIKHKLHKKFKMANHLKNLTANFQFYKLVEYKEVAFQARQYKNYMVNVFHQHHTIHNQHMKP